MKILAHLNYFLLPTFKDNSLSLFQTINRFTESFRDTVSITACDLCIPGLAR